MTLTWGIATLSTHSREQCGYKHYGTIWGTYSPLRWWWLIWTICLWETLKTPTVEPKARNTPSRRKAVFFSLADYVFSVCSTPLAEVGPCQHFFGRFHMLSWRRSSLVSRAIWSFLLAVQLVNQCTRKAQNGRNTWLSGVERWLGVSVQLWTQMLPAWADHTVCVLDLRSKRAVCANNVSSGLHCICSYMYKVVI